MSDLTKEQPMYWVQALDAGTLEGIETEYEGVEMLKYAVMWGNREVAWYFCREDAERASRIFNEAHALKDSPTPAGRTL